ncbi:HesA/MoeB/ThiF family protein [Sinobacterium caligoides]|uniref:HesA/MoeB/ThiF family protein n=1 Tax=Sinobacterium caligoides TaxID=933926 RepID=UPI001B868DE7|nr:molybdopterin-synthase adenylyltransferase MoeB [Sinobacterium caligoides]
MNDQQMLRYSRQIMLDDIDIAGQQTLMAATVLVVGAGGLGCPVAMYLASAGVGKLIIADDDQVELSNLQRQIGHGEQDLRKLKVASLEETLRDINPEVQIETIHRRLQGDSLSATVAKVDMVVDASDNFKTRFALNAACVVEQKPLISGAAIRMEGQVTAFDPRLEHSPCYRCLYSEQEHEDSSCSSNGVLAPLVGIIGSLQAFEAIKLLVGFGESLVGRLLIFDGKYLEWRELKISRDPKCPICGDFNGA